MAQFSFHFDSQDFVKAQKRFQEINGTVFSKDSDFIKEFFNDFMKREGLDGESE